MTIYPPYGWRADGGYRPPPFDGGNDYYLDHDWYSVYSYFTPDPVYTGYWYGYEDLPPTPPPAEPKKKKKAKKAKGAKKADEEKKAADDDTAPGVTGSGSDMPGATLPATTPAGATVLHGAAFASLHVITNGVKPWERSAAGQHPEFLIAEVDVEWSVQKLLRALGKGAEGWVVTEAIEVGDGRWRKGTSVKWGEERAAERLEGFGWNGKRGKEWPPVYVAVHKG